MVKKSYIIVDLIYDRFWDGNFYSSWKNVKFFESQEEAKKELEEKIIPTFRCIAEIKEIYTKMHTLPVLKDWKVSALHENCIKINIDPDLDLEGSSIKILGSERNLLTVISPDSYEIQFCTYTGRPMFVELHTPSGVSVKYVQGSGKDFYQNYN